MTEQEQAECAMRGACLAWGIDPAESTMQTLAELCGTLSMARAAIIRGREAMPGSRVFAMLDSLREDLVRTTIRTPAPEGCE